MRIWDVIGGEIVYGGDIRGIGPCVVCFRREGNEWTVWVNGKITGLSTASISISNGTGAQCLRAQEYGDSNRILDGWLGYTQFWHRALHVAEIQYLSKNSLQVFNELFIPPLQLITVDISTNITVALNVTEQNDTSAISGSVIHAGTVNVTENNDTSSITVSQVHIGTVSVTEENDIPTISGTVGAGGGITGSVNVTEEDDVSAIIGKLVFTGSVNITESDDTSNISGNLKYIGTVNVVEADDTANITGSVPVPFITGTVVVTEQNDSSVISGTVKITATIAATEQNDSSEITARIPITGTINVVEQNDSSNIIVVQQLPIILEYDDIIVPIPHPVLDADENQRILETNFDVIKQLFLKFQNQFLNAWHHVGDSSEPAFDTDWQNVNVTIYGYAGFRDNGLNVVQLKGRVEKISTIAANGDTIFTLPENYRPTFGIIKAVPISSFGVGDMATLAVTPAGQVQIWSPATIAANTAIILDINYSKDNP